MADFFLFWVLFLIWKFYFMHISPKLPNIGTKLTTKDRIYMIWVSFITNSCLSWDTETQRGKTFIFTEKLVGVSKVGFEKRPIWGISLDIRYLDHKYMKWKLKTFWSNKSVDRMSLSCVLTEISPESCSS